MTPWQRASERPRNVATAGAPCAEPYLRTLLHRDREREVMLARWRPLARCAPHDHGRATGRVVILDGQFVERRWQLRDGVLQQTDERRLHAGDDAQVTAGLVHCMQALSAGTTLHLYTPSVAEMRVFDVAAREILTVADECGAWLPSDPRLVRARVAFGQAELPA